MNSKLLVFLWPMLEEIYEEMLLQTLRELGAVEEV